MEGRSIIEQQIEKESAMCPLYNFIVKDEYIYCFSWKYNLFLKFCIATGTIEYKKVLDRYLTNAFMLYRLICIEDKIVALPYIANHIIIWNPESMDMEELPLPIKYADETNLRKFNTYAYIEQEHRIVLFPGDIEYICEFDLVHNTVRELLNIREYLLKNYNFQYSFFANGSYIKDNNVYLGCFETNKIIKYNITANTVDLIVINQLDAAIRSICGSENIIYILLNNGKVVIRNIDTLETSVIPICDPEEVAYWNTGEERIMYYCGYVFAFSEKIELSKKIRITDKKVMSVFTPQNISDIKKKNANQELFFGYFDTGTIYAYSYGGDIFCFNVDVSEEVNHIQLQYDVDQLLKWLKLNLNNTKMMYEDKYIYNICGVADIIDKKRSRLELNSAFTKVGEIVYSELSKT